MKTESDYRKTVAEAIRFNVILNQAVTKNSRSGFTGTPSGFLIHGCTALSFVSVKIIEELFEPIFCKVFLLNLKWWLFGDLV